MNLLAYSAYIITCTAVSIFLILPYTSFLTIIILPLFAALVTQVLIYSTNLDLKRTQRYVLDIALTFLGTFIGCLISKSVYSASAYNLLWKAEFPKAFIRDLQDAIPNTYANLLFANHPLISSDNILSIVIVSILACLIVTVSLKVLGRNYNSALAWILLFLLSGLFIVNAQVAAADFRSAISAEFEDGTYYYDGATYLKAYYLMDRMDYYEAYVEAFENKGDEAKTDSIQNGKFVRISDPIIIREPTIFYIWKFIAPINAVPIFYASITICALLLAFTFTTLRSITDDRAIFSVIALVPYYFSGAIWTNIFLPDWWAGLAMMAALLFFVRRSSGAAAFLMLLASLIREVLFPFLLLCLFLYLFYWIRGRKESLQATKLQDLRSHPVDSNVRSSIIYYAVASVIFSGIYYLHYINASKYITDSLTGRPSFTSYLASFNWDHFVENTSFLMFHYGMYSFPSYVFIFMAIVVFVIKKRFDVGLIILFTVPYYFLSTSTYWGQHFMPFIIVGAFLSVALINFSKPDDNHRRPSQGSA